MTEPLNDYDSAEDEAAAWAASYAGQAHILIFNSPLFDRLNDREDAGDKWARKVTGVLYDAVNALEALAREEVAERPGMPELGQQWAAKWDAEHADIKADMEAQDAAFDAA